MGEHRTSLKITSTAIRKDYNDHRRRTIQKHFKQCRTNQIQKLNKKLKNGQ